MAMTQAPTRTGVAGRLAWLTRALPLAVGLYVLVTFLQVWSASLRDEARPAQAVIVLGAAQYDGRPSAVLRARLDHAAELYHTGLAPLVVVTGGQRPGDRFTEAWAAATYLYGQDIPDEAMRREVGGQTSWESLAATARFLRAEGVRDVLLVSDPFHSYRVAAIADEVGLRAHVSPTRTSPITGLAVVRQLGRETAAVSVGRLIGYRRMANLERLWSLAALAPPASETAASAARTNGHTSFL